jgi:dTDP-glucose 4,6-dehydratase
MNLLITGGCGFIGSHYINYIFNKINDINIINIDAMYYCASENNVNIKKSSRYTFYKMNLNEYEKLCNILKNHNITHIIHFAAQSHVDNSFNDSLQYTYDNVQGTHTLLEAIKNTNLNIILLHFSTDEVYGESYNDIDLKCEKSLLCPTNPYAASKAAAEMYVMSYIKSFGLKAIITRGNNVYGDNQYPEKLIPKFISLLLSGKKCTIHGKGDSIRSFIHVYDVCVAVEIILKFGSFGEIYNIGSNPENEKTVIDVAKYLINKLFNTEDYDKYIEYVNDRPFNDKRYFIDNKKLKNLEWEQTINFNEGVYMVINNMKEKYNYGYIIYEKNNNWIEIYNKIRENDNAQIILITKSNIDICKYINLKIQKNEFNDNIYIPFYYYCKNKYFNKAIILNKYIDNIKDKINNDYYFLEIKDNTLKQTNISEINIIKKLDSNLLEKYTSDNWNSCNLNMIISYNYIENINNKYKLFDNIKNINNNIMENILSFLITIN